MTAADPLFSAPEIDAIFSRETHVRYLLAFEAALARALARIGALSSDAARAIGEACHVDLYDIPTLYAEAARAGTVVVPLVRAIAAHVDGDAAGFVHFGATSQDAIDTAFVLQARDGLDWLDARLAALADSCATLAEQHRETLMAGRTLLQQALPITFGLKAARWLALVMRQQRRLRQAREEALVLQFGGAVGTLAAYGHNGPRIMELLAAELGLAAPDLPWHAERDRIAALAAALGITAGAMAKIAVDIVLLAQTEVGEVAEAEEAGKGRSSAMPQKRNPVDATFTIAAARLAASAATMLLNALAHEHERAAGAWQAEWEALPRLFCWTAGALEHASRAVGGLHIDAQRMRAALEAKSGVIMAEALATALARSMGRPEAQRLVAALCDRALAQARPLQSVASEEPRVVAALTPDEIARVLQPENYLGSAATFVERALAAYRAATKAQAGTRHPA